MKKVFLIGWKDVIIAFRDRAALIMMLAAPFVLTLGLGFVTGRFSGASSTGLSDIPVALINYDGGQLGDGLVSVFQSTELDELIAPTLMTDESLARFQVDEDQMAAVVIIPEGFTESILPTQGQETAGETVPIVLYTNPNRPTSSGVVKTIVEGFVNQVEIGRVGGHVIVEGLVMNGLVAVEDAAKTGQEIGLQQGAASNSSSSVRIRNVAGEEPQVAFDVLAYLAPGMALMFLMYTVSSGGRTLLTERRQGTLSRLMVSPTATAYIMAGKVFGIFLTGVAQMLILIGGTTLLFQLEWGDPLAVLMLVLAAVFGAVGWGMLLTAFAKTPGQVSAVGSALMLLFGILGGSFIDIGAMPAWLRAVSMITPNAWGLNGFSVLAVGGSLNQIFQPILALLAMGVVLFIAAVVAFNRRGMLQS